MNILVLGGAGDMGSCTVEDLAQTAGVTRVTIADRDTNAAEALRQRLADAPAQVAVQPLDATDHGAVVAAMRAHDATASALGPFYIFEPKLVAAALEAGVPYASICDDWVATRDVIERYDGPAREAGVPIITGVGASPGLTNIIALYLAQQMDRATRVDVSVYQPWNAGGGEAVLRHLLFIISGQIGSFRAGQFLEVEACSEQRQVEFPYYGRRTLWNLGHPEPVTLWRHIEGLEEVDFWMGLGSGMGALVALARRGWFDSPAKADRTLRWLAPFERLLTPERPGISSIRVDVYGERDGTPAHEMICGTGLMRDTTGLPLSVGTQLLAAGKTLCQGGGVFAPEACFEPLIFWERMREKGIDGFTDLAMTQAVRPAA